MSAKIKPETMSGSVGGGSRADLVKDALDSAKIYYGIECVAVRLAGATVIRGGGPWDGTADRLYFTAEFEAREQHRLSQRAYGHPKCQVCDREFPDGFDLAEWSIE